MEEKMIIDQLKPGAEFENTVEVAAELMENDHACRLMAEIAKEEGTEYFFALTAGAEWPMEGLFMKSGIKRVHVRHEQTATFAADAMARIKRKPAVAVIGPSTGLTNAASGLAQAMAAQSPVVVVAGEHPASHDSIYFAQGLVQAEKLYGGITKWTKRLTNPTSILPEFKRAIRIACTPPTGPTCVALPWDVSYTFSRQPKAALYSLYSPGNLAVTQRHQTGEAPDLVKKALEWLLAAERPAIVTGEGVYYDDAQQELREFVKITGIPTHSRRLSRGAISEYDPINCGGRARGRVLRSADRVLVMGLRIGYLEMHGNPPFWGTNTRYIQAQTCMENVDLVLPTEYELIGNMKTILGQMIACVQDMGINKPLEKWQNWRDTIATSKKEYENKTIARSEKMRGKSPFHPDLAGRLTYEFLRDELNDDYYAIIDGFTASSFFTDWNKMRNAGRILDASETIGIGHGVGMAIGAALATDKKTPILALMGDGGLGAGGMDIETAVRWELPIVFLHENNDVLVAGGWKLFWSKACNPTGNQLLDSWQTLPGIRYDKMFAEFGCHTEFVRNDYEYTAALKRAFDYVRDHGKPAFVEVFVDPEVMNEIWSTFLTACCGFLDWDDIPEEGKKAITELGLVNPAFASHCPTWPPEALGRRKK
jgi:acetolactate synthase-1/2/3 large subunit